MLLLRQTFCLKPVSPEIESKLLNPEATSPNTREALELKTQKPSNRCLVVDDELNILPLSRHAKAGIPSISSSVEFRALRLYGLSGMSFGLALEAL